jgi:GNAT superfamily N-acetyltransferase
MISYRLMKYSDIPAGLSLCRAAGWNQVARDWEAFLHLNPDGCLIATNGDQVVGTVATLRYQHCFSWIGMVLVDPACRRQGIGSGLLNEALQLLHNEQTIKLDATPAGRDVYVKLDFFDEYPLSRMVCTNWVKKVTEANVRSISKNDLPAVAALDHKVFGTDRKLLLEWMFEGGPQFAFGIEAENEIQGYCLGRRGYSFTHIGPVIAKDLKDAKKLVTAALDSCIGHAVVLDISCFDLQWKQWLTLHGFTEQRAFMRMYRGSNLFSFLSEHQFAILGPEFG